MNNHGSGDLEDRLRALELAINGIQRDAENHQRWAATRSDKMDQIDKTLQELRMEIHGAKIGGRVALGIALTMGSLLGWIAAMLKDHMVKMLLVGALVFCASCQLAQTEQKRADDTLASRREVHEVTESGSRKAVSTATQFGWDFSKFLQDNAGLLSVLLPAVGLGAGHLYGKSAATRKIEKERAAKWVRHSDQTLAKAAGVDTRS